MNLSITFENGVLVIYVNHRFVRGVKSFEYMQEGAVLSFNPTINPAGVVRDLQRVKGLELVNEEGRSL